MEYVVVFLAGAVASAVALGIGCFAYAIQMRVERQRVQNLEARLTAQATEFDQRTQAFAETQRHAEQALAMRGDQQARELAMQKEMLDRGLAAFESRKVAYESLVRENAGLKQDCFNLSVHVKKTGLDHVALARRQDEIAQKAEELADRYLQESVSWIGEKLTPNNFSSCKQRLLNVIGACRAIGFDVPPSQEQELLRKLQAEFEQAVKDEFARQEQARIRARIREEEKLAREIEKQIKDAEREKAAIEAALVRALREAKDEHSAEVELLQARLKEAEEKSQRAISQAQLTKAGHVYVLSNIGTLGEGVYKIGMTRRLEPEDRVRELGDASVPFPFDIHMMIACDDAPSLENALHRELHKQRVNKVNFRKEFFRADFDSIVKVVESAHGQVEYRAEPEAFQYRESMRMPDEDYDFIENTVQSVVGDGDAAPGDDE